MLECKDDQRPFLLPEEDHENIYQSYVRPILDDFERDIERPVASFLGAQPGSGKTRLRELISNEYDGIVINTDELRWYHPEYNRLLENPQTNHRGSYLVDPDATDWSIRLFNEAIQQRSNVTIDSTFGGNPVHTIARLERLHALRYQNDFHIIAVNSLVSRLGIFLRFENGSRSGTPERMVPMHVHDANFRRLPENLFEIRQTCANLINKLCVYSRGQNLSWSVIFETLNPCNFDQAIQALNNERQRPFTEEEEQKYIITKDEVRRMILERGGDEGAFLEAIGMRI